VGYRTPRGRAAEVKLPWRVLSPGKARTAMDERSRAAGKMAADLSGEAVRRAKKLMFATDLWAQDRERPAPIADSAPRDGGWLATSMQDVLAARELSPEVGYLRIWSFDLEDDEAFVLELTGCSRCCRRPA
jgi:hypothetical protein